MVVGFKLLQKPVVKQKH